MPTFQNVFAFRIQNKKSAPIVTALNSTLNSDALATYTGKELRTFESHFLFGQHGKLQMTMQSSSAEGMKDRGHNRDPKKCHVKLKELSQAYQKTREANRRFGSEPKTCHFYDELHAILGGSATTTPTMLFDSFSGVGGNMEAGFGDEEDDDDKVVHSSQQASRETGFPDSQELFLTLDLEPVTPEPIQGCLLEPPGGEGTSVRMKPCSQHHGCCSVVRGDWTGDGDFADTIVKG
ncbi:hypothetical protein UY3_17534 [Chelonia mydas]|uniref:Myb/SANT-like DNA-binding domain-containing protein n=1 Tax=Chelonia mydas TaxID=8469 RepID=M7ARD6_CHEMY|nr:hypothetical protein UY3_17534 [Chelonia mydas]